MDIYKILINEGSGCEKVSLVHYPAVEKDFLAFSKKGMEPRMNLSFSSDEEREVWGVAMLADTPIYRRDGDYEYYIVFEKDAIKKMVLKYFKEKRIADVNLEHFSDVDGVTLIESVITSDRVALKGFEDVPEGSWVIGMKVENDAVWESIKKGELRGFSIEGLFNFELVPTELKDEETDFFESLVD